MTDYDDLSYDAVLLVSFGGPEKPEDVVPFLRNVTRGRDIPDERLKEVGEHYFAFGGRSPINDQCRALKRALKESLKKRAADDPTVADLPVYWGNRNWDPYLADTMRAMRADGVRRVLCLLTSAYASYSSCRQYRENLAEALANSADSGDPEPELVRLPHYFQREGFQAPFVDGTIAALETLPPGSTVAFVTHSIPTAMNDASGPAGLGGGRYLAEHTDAAASIIARIAERTGTAPDWELVYCSRSGPPSQPWLEPDINDHLRDLADRGIPGVAAVPIGFVSDHMEVIYDLDTEAKATADECDLPYRRVPTPGTDPRFVGMLTGLIARYVDGSVAADGSVGEPLTAVRGEFPEVWLNCATDCCRNLRADLPVACRAT